jgi:hypothetical protein
MAEAGPIHRFDAAASWSGDASSGRFAPDGRSAFHRQGDPFSAARAEGNPEEFPAVARFASVGGLPQEVAVHRLARGRPGRARPQPCRRLHAKAVIRVRVQAARRGGPAQTREDPAAEKYCIISKVARAAMPLTVEIEEA